MRSGYATVMRLFFCVNKRLPVTLCLAPPHSHHHYSPPPSPNTSSITKSTRTGSPTQLTGKIKQLLLSLAQSRHTRTYMGCTM
ncbi:hypothetical protein EMCRGX_G016498 [Ephydatia muelleri]